MASDPNFQASIADQATHWWVLLDSGNVTPEDRREFAMWVGQTPDRLAAFLRTAAVMKAAKSPSIRWPSTSSEDLVAAAKASGEREPLHIHPVPRRAPPHSDNAGGRIPWSRLAMASAASVLVLLGATWFTLGSAQEFHTRFGERRSVLLEDGSRISLNTESTIKVELRKDRRLVSLDAGEALFEVKKDPQRPFDVRVGDVLVRVVGTEFNIDRSHGRTTISVVEGRVAVTTATVTPEAAKDSNSPSADTVFLNASDRLIVGGSTPDVVEHGVNLGPILAWTESKIVLAHTPLGRATQEFNRYNKPGIQIRGTTLQNREISGVFKSDDPGSFLTFLARVPGISIHDAADGTHIVEQSP